MIIQILYVSIGKRNAKLYVCDQPLTDLTAFSDLRWGQRTFSKRMNRNRKTQHSTTSNFVQCHCVCGAQCKAYDLVGSGKKVSRWHIFPLSWILLFLPTCPFALGACVARFDKNEVRCIFEMLMPMLDTIKWFSWTTSEGKKKKSAKWPMRPCTDGGNFVLDNVRWKTKSKTNIWNSRSEQTGKLECKFHCFIFRWLGSTFVGQLVGGQVAKNNTVERNWCIFLFQLNQAKHLKHQLKAPRYKKKKLKRNGNLRRKMLFGPIQPAKHT